MGIRFKGYNCLHSNSTYCRRVILEEGSRRVPAYSIISISRYSEPSEQQIVDNIISAASSIKQKKLFLGKESKVSDLEARLIALPETILDFIINQHPDYIELLRASTPAMPDINGYVFNSYLHLGYGYLPIDFVHRNKDSISEPEWYSEQLERHRNRATSMGRRWIFNMKISSGNLPNRRELNVLLKHRTHGSETIDFNLVDYPIEEVMGVIDALYAGISSSDDIKLIRDISQKMVASLSNNAMVELNNLTNDFIEANGGLGDALRYASN